MAQRLPLLAVHSRRAVPRPNYNLVAPEGVPLKGSLKGQNMTHFLSIRRTTSRILPLALAAVTWFGSAEAATAQAGNCDSDGGCGFMACKAPAKPAPSQLWGDLEPVDSSPLPLTRDNTDFNEFGGGIQNTYGPNNPFWMSIDIDSGFLYAAISHGVQIWDLRTTPANPSFVSLFPGPSKFRFWASGELKLPLRDIDVDGNLGAVVGKGNIGIGLIDFSDRSTPRFLYQDDLKQGDQVYATTLGGRSYAFFATSQSSDIARPGGVLVYDMTAARSFNTPCLDTSEDCPGVYQGRLGSRTSAAFVDGTGNYVVLSAGAQRGFEIYDVSTPTQPQLKLSALSGTSGTSVYGVALWRSGSNYYLAMRNDTEGKIYDVSCIATSCTGLGGPVWSQSMPSGSPEFYVTHSEATGRHYVYFGSDNKCGSGTPDPQREFLIDATIPSQARDLTPPQTVNIQLQAGGTSPVNYWTWYYRRSPSGFNQVMPRMGMFHNEYFYRAALSILDIHRRTGGVVPVADFASSPTEVYPSTPVTFTDQSAGNPTSWSWTFAPDGSPASSNVRNPSGVTFATPGTKTITLTATNTVGPSTPRVKTITVIDPNPVIASVAVSPSNPIVCQPVTFTATGVTGQPPLTYTWNLTTRPGGSPVTSGNGTSFLWNTVGAIAGDYKMTLTVQGVSTVMRDADFTLGALAQLPTSFAPTADPFTSGTVQFHVVAAGATEWNWDFGDGLGFRGWTNDPITGPNPSVTYTTTGQKSVVVKIRNCVEAERTSTALVINVTQTTPLVANFSATAGAFCTGVGCAGTQGVAITFTDFSTGAQFWDYDWDGNGSFEESGRTTPQTTHTYGAVGTFTPRLKVRRGGSEENIFTHRSITIGNPTPASITISGPTSGNINAAMSFSASASGCSPGASSWAWTVGGGTVSGGTSSSSITITWTTTGTKTISASNSDCSGASDSHTISVTDPGSGGGGTLAAQFSFLPTAPTAGQAVAFDAGASTGSPTGYDWNFGDNTTGTGRNVSHSYTTNGTYSVRLTVLKPGTGAGCLLGTCAAEIVKTVVVGTTPPPTFDVNFSTSATCINSGSLELCSASTGQALTFAAIAQGATSWNWSFGDGGTATTSTTTHTFAQPGTFSVTLTASNGTQTKSKTKTFEITGPVAGNGNLVVLPWIAQTRGAVRQSSDLYVHNPSESAIDVSIKFRKRGITETNPPQATRTIAAGATLFIADVLGELFSRDNSVGFVTVELMRGALPPVVLSFNNTFQTDGKRFGQTIPGISMARAGTATPTPENPVVQQLVGLNDSSERVAYFGISNPNDQPASYRLKFFNAAGAPVATSEDFTLARFGQKQFQLQEIRDIGVSGLSDYRVLVEQTAGGQILPYGANLRLSTQDPSFIGTSPADATKLYLVGSLSQPGLNNSLFQTDIVIANPFARELSTDIGFISAGVGSQPEIPVRVTLAPGESERLINVIGDRWRLTNTVGVLSFASTTSGGPLPLVMGESYDNANPTRRFGQSMIPQSDLEAATVRGAQYLVGLRQDDDYRTTFWLFNAGSDPGTYDLVYRRLDGTVIGQLTNLSLLGGRMRQFRPSDHPFAGSNPGGFTVQVVVKAGKALAAAQVVDNLTNDPAYVRGESR